jgi:anti-anti-sigma factor
MRDAASGLPHRRAGAFGARDPSTLAFPKTLITLPAVVGARRRRGPALALRASAARGKKEKTEKMTTRITQLEGRIAGGRALLRVEGSLGLADAELLEQVCTDLKSQTGANVTIDLADISFLDSESASVLARMRREQEVSLEGVHFFIQQVIEIAERAN